MLDACLIVNGSWRKAHGWWLMAKGGRPGPGSQGSRVQWGVPGDTILRHLAMARPWPWAMSHESSSMKHQVSSINIDQWLMIIDYWLLTNIRRCVFRLASGGSNFRKKHLFFFETFYRKRKLQKLTFFVKSRTLNPRFLRKTAPAFRFPPLHWHGALPHTTSLIQLPTMQVLEASGWRHEMCKLITKVWRR